MSQPPPATSPNIRWPRRLARLLLALVLGTLWLALLGWATLAICFAASGLSPRYFVAAGFAMIALAAAILIRRPLYARLALLGLFAVTLAWYFMLTPSNDRDWTVDVSQLPWAQFDGNKVTIHNVRNFDYRSETDFTPNWEDRTYDLDHLKSADFILSHWGSDDIAHAIVSFGFDDGRYLAISIETRKEKGESYSALQGFFRQYELAYVIADERDVLRVRTNYRNEDLYVYQTRFAPEHARAALRSYLDQATSLRQQPQWYNALTTNCATSVLPHARAGGAPAATLSLDILLSGHAAKQIYRNGNLDDRLPFDELRRRCRVNDAAKAADRDPDFSNKIRAGLPSPARLAAK